MNADANIAAFLTMIRACEGTAGHDGYQAMFGYPAPGRLIASFADHPRRKFAFTQTDGTKEYSSAAGAYQFIVRTWDRLKAKLGLPDFGPESQDEAAIELIREAGALPDVKLGRIQTAINKCGGVWASLPSSSYPQPKRSLTFALHAYDQAGGERL